MTRRHRSGNIRRVRKWIAGVAGAAAGLAALPALAGKADDTLRFAFQQTLDHADPYFNTLVIGGTVADEVWDGLISLPVYYVANRDLVFTPYPDEIPRFWDMSWR